MDVTVTMVISPYAGIPTEALREILRNHAEDKLLHNFSDKQLFDIMGELARRDRKSGEAIKSASEAWDEFRQIYLSDV